MIVLYNNAKVLSEGQSFAGGVLVKDGVIEELLPAQATLPPADKIVDLKGAYLLPGFIDTHIHGCGGYGTDTKNPQDILAMSELLLKQGVIAFMPTIYPAPLEEMCVVLDKLSAVIGQEKGAKILGFHIEGPYISPAKPGVMKPGDIQGIDLESIKKMYKAARGKIAAMTAAPELAGIEALAAFAKEKNFLLQAGHTNASYEQMLRGAELGLTHSTHLFNAMSSINHREPGAPGAVLTDQRFTAEVIADGVHLHPAVVKMVLMLKGPANIVLVTDSLNPTGRQEGRANGEEVKLEGGVFRRVADNVIAGSALTMLDGLKNLVKWGYPLHFASMAASDNPARLHNLKTGVIAKGYAAQFAVLDKDLNLQQVIF